MCNCMQGYVCSKHRIQNFDLNPVFIQQPMECKVVSLDTYRELIKEIPKDEAMKGSSIVNQAGLDQHYANIITVNESKTKGTEILAFNTDDKVIS